MKAAAPISPIAPTSQGATRKGAPAPVGASLAAGLASGGGAGTWAGLLDAAAAQPTAPEDVAVEEALLDLDADGAPLAEGVVPRTALGHPGAQAEALASPEPPDHGAESTGQQGESFDGDVDLPEWRVAAPRAELGQAANRAASLGPQAALGHPGSQGEALAASELASQGDDLYGDDLYGDAISDDADPAEWLVGANPRAALGHPGSQGEALAASELASQGDDLYGDDLYGDAISDDADPAEWLVGANPRAALGHPGAQAEALASPEPSVHGAESTGQKGEPFDGDADLPEWRVAAPRAELGQAANRAASLGPQAGLGRPSASLGQGTGAPATALQASAGTDDLSTLVAAFSRPDSAVAVRQGRGLGVSEPGARALEGARLGGAPRLDAEKPTAPSLAANPRGSSSVRSASPVDLLGPAPRAAATFDAAPWLGLEPALAADSSVRADGHTPAAPAGLREALAASTPGRFALLSDQVAAEASARAAALTRGDVEADRSRPAAPTAPRALPTPRAALEVAERAAPAEAPIEPVGGESDAARRPAPAAAARVATRAPTATPVSPSALPIAGDAVATTPGANAALPAATTVTRVHTLQAATVVDARFTDGQVPQQIGAPDLTRIELEVEEGDHALKVTLAREADGLAVEVRGPREVVAELRALRPEVDAALAEEGFDLTAYDADEDPDAGSRDADDDDALEGDDTPTPTATASADGAPRGRAGLLDRQA